jgi:hypothetical protein
MKLWHMLATFTVAGALTATPALAIAPSIHSDPTTGGRADASGGPASATEATVGQTIEGRIAAVERQSGRFLLDTDEGPVALVTSPSELSGVQVGDFVQVSLVSDDRE